MAIITFNNGIVEIHGKVGERIYRRGPNGSTIVCKRPDMSGVQPSEAQKAHRQRFKQAVAYAKAALADPELRARYEAQATCDKTPYNLALADYLKNMNHMSS